jgi:hypothetical protein
MLRKFIRASLCGVLGLVATMLAYGASTAADEKAPDVSTIMQKSFGKGGFKTSIPAAAKGEKWEDAQKLAKEWAAMGAAIGKNKAPKGEAKSWEEQCAKFSDATKAILKATEDKDVKAVGKAVGSFNCGGCHKAHKP